ncbi:MAG TPA: jacalin-like lectin [Longimicrobium sp.]
MTHINPPAQLDLPPHAPPDKIQIPGTLQGPIAEEKPARRPPGGDVAISAPPEPFIVGPSGGTGGREFTTGVIPPGAVLRVIRVWHDAFINGIATVYQVPGKDPFPLPMHGSDAGRCTPMELRHGEYVTEISGRYGAYVDSLVIRTSHGRVERFGGRGGHAEYRYTIFPGLELCGFGGQAGAVIDAIGPKLRRAEQFTARPDELVYGPSGDFHGTRFRDRPIPPEARITGVRLHVGSHLNGIGLTYEEAGLAGDLALHGSRDGSAEHFVLEPDEYVTGISGCYSSAVRGIRVITNRRVSMPFGWDSLGVPFVFKTRPANGPGEAAYEVVGLLGYAGEGVDALGVVYRRRTTFPLPERFAY